MSKEIEKSELVELFLKRAFTGCTYISMDTETVQSLTGGKKNPMKGKVIKRCVGHNVGLFENKNSNGYENMVKKRLEGEGKDSSEFELQPRTWGVRIKETPLVFHKGEYYLEVIFKKSGKVEYLYEGEIINKDEIEGFPVSKGTSGQSGLKNQVQIRTFKLDSITQLKMNKEVYLLK